MGGSKGKGTGTLDAVHAAMGRIQRAEQAAKTRALESRVDRMSEQLAKQESMKDDEALLTSSEVAALLGVTHPKTVEKWAREKGLPRASTPGSRMLRFKRSEVLRWRDQRGKKG